MYLTIWQHQIDNAWQGRSTNNQLKNELTQHQIPVGLASGKLRTMVLLECSLLRNVAKIHTLHLNKFLYIGIARSRQHRNHQALLTIAAICPCYERHTVRYDRFPSELIILLDDRPGKVIIYTFYSTLLFLNPLIFK